MNSCVEMGSVFLVFGCATVRTNVVMPQMNATAISLPLRTSPASAPPTHSHALWPIPPSVCPPAGCATEPETAQMAQTRWAALTPPVENI